MASELQFEYKLRDFSETFYQVYSTIPRNFQVLLHYYLEDVHPQHKITLTPTECRSLIPDRRDILIRRMVTGSQSNNMIGICYNP
jgi:hypothetical protein